MIFTVLLRPPVSVHHCLAADSLSSSLWVGRLPGGHMGMDAGCEEREQELWMAGWASQLGASPGPVAAEELRVPTSKGWSDFKRSPCLLIWGTGELPGWGTHSPETLGFGLATEPVGSWQQRRKLPCAGLPMCLPGGAVSMGEWMMAFSLCLLPSAPHWGWGHGPEKMRRGRGTSTAGPGCEGRRTECRGCRADASTPLPGGQGESWDFTSQTWATGEVQGVGLRDTAGCVSRALVCSELRLPVLTLVVWLNWHQELCLAADLTWDWAGWGAQVFPKMYSTKQGNTLCDVWTCSSCCWLPPARFFRPTRAKNEQKDFSLPELLRKRNLFSFSELGVGFFWWCQPPSPWQRCVLPPFHSLVHKML